MVWKGEWEEVEGSGTGGNMARMGESEGVDGIVGGDAQMGGARSNWLQGVRVDGVDGGELTAGSGPLENANRSGGGEPTSG